VFRLQNEGGGTESPGNGNAPFDDPGRIGTRGGGFGLGSGAEGTGEAAIPLYACTIFGGASLLFLLQLITAKQILPWFGGAAAVWTTCLVFFQVALLLGYVYADWTSRRLAPGRQAVVHVMLLVLSLALLPLVPDAAWKPASAQDPLWRILGLLGVTVGLPYFLLSTTSPLLQAWFARAYPARSPYRLFALSNLASVLALLSYPLAIEPWLTVGMQARVWALAYTGFVVLCSAAAWHALRHPSAMQTSTPAVQRPAHRAAAQSPPTWGEHLLWAALAAAASFLLLAVTNHLSQDVAAVPLLWVLPLSVYLLSFILCFDAPHWYPRGLYAGLLALAVFAMASEQLIDQRADAFGLGLRFQIGLYTAGLFIACMFCHGELNRLRPAQRHLTRFYLMIALGGAGGALLVGIVAPLVFRGTYELALGLVALAALMLYQARQRGFAVVCAGAATVLYATGAAFYAIDAYRGDAYLMTRNFYGVLRVRDMPYESNPKLLRRELVYGRITQGDQMLEPGLRRALGTYYRTTSGIGRALIALKRPEARVGVIGLGVGTIAAYGRPGDVYRFYELNPAVIDIARREFTYLKYSAANIEIVPGDARLNLEREEGQRFDVLAVDAFAGDAIPVHLLTREALALYLRRVKAGGVIAFHLSNRYLDLVPAVRRLAEAAGLKAEYVADRSAGAGQFESDWVLVSADQTFFDLPEVTRAASIARRRPDRRLWTDDFSNLLQVLK